ncbi:dynactin subunit 3 isoform X4 [Macaca nemestrina]|uniref:dynactin subunit 3 isoform X8 n=1 Tax=Macaca fascicularis TaxID=9541 RepID=UPI001E252E93|nr:dynactin subunit 3 isoform X7 [Macaca fascicularis]
MAGLTDVQRLQARVEELERWVYGPGGARGSRKVADGLVKVQVALGNIASKRERVKILYKKIEDLIKYLDPEYIDRIAIPDASKLQFILAAVPEHAARLQHLAQIHIQQQAPFCATLWPYRTSVWRSLRSPRLSWRNTTRLQCFYPSNLCSGMSYFAS